MKYKNYKILNDRIDRQWKLLYNLISRYEAVFEIQKYLVLIYLLFYVYYEGMRFF